jgi:DNA-binding beta-propeller fold protein YncE
VLLAALAGCAGFKVRTTGYGDRIGWPPEDPRVRLVSVIDLRRGPQRSRPTLPGVQATEATAPAFRRPYAAAWLGDDLLVSDPDRGRVARVGADGKVIFSADRLFVRPVGVAACSAGILVTDSERGSVSILGPDLKRIGFLARGLQRPTGIACDGGEIYVVETGAHRVLVYGSGDAPRALGARGSDPGRFNYPTSVAIHAGPSGRVLLVGDSMNFRIQLLDPASGASLRQFGRLGDAPGEMPRIKGVGVDGGRRVWVSDAHLDRVSLYDREGSLLITIGSSGSQPGEFSFPAGIAAHPDGRVAVVDSYNRRIQILRVENTE